MKLLGAKWKATTHTPTLAQAEGLTLRWIAASPSARNHPH